jgi:hypothetical protein
MSTHITLSIVNNDIKSAAIIRASGQVIVSFDANIKHASYIISGLGYSATCDDSFSNSDELVDLWSAYLGDCKPTHVTLVNPIIKWIPR